MSLEKEKQIIDTIRRCQRNWDHSKSIPDEHLAHWVYIAQNSPSKQDESYFNLYVITSKEKIDLLLNHTWGHTMEIAPGNFTGVTRNTQMAANAYFLFTFKLPPTNREIKEDGSLYDQSGKDFEERKRNGYVDIGIAAGLIAQSAADLGYKTGFNTNHNSHQRGGSEPSTTVWRETLGLEGHEAILVGLGIGYPEEGRARNEHNETEFLVGTYPGTRHNVNDDYILINGEQRPTPKIHYKTYSEKTKLIKVKRL
jgi:nitroreductase